jgi:T-complex protein 1 subunit gamma
MSLCLQHANAENPMFGIDGNTGEITDMKELGVSRLTRFLFLLD